MPIELFCLSAIVADLGETRFLVNSTTEPSMNHTTQSSFEQDNGLSSVVVKAASLLFFIVVGVYSNGRVIHTVLLGDVRRPVLNFFVASLSIADLASCLIVMPFVFVSLVFGEWVFGRIFCTIHTMLSTYFANVAFLSVGAMVYERYQAIYRRRFPSLSKRQVTVLLFFIWIFPIPFTAPMLGEEFTYAEYAGLCFINAAEKWNAASIIKFLVKAVGVLIILFSFWKVFTFLLSLRRRVSPGLLSNEEKLTIAAFVHSGWTLTVFIVIYLILNTPIVIVLIVNKQRRNVGKDTIPDNLACVFLWMYWLQCAAKPIIYFLRSPRCMNCQCRRHHAEMTNESTTSCFSRDRSHVYEVRDDSLENTISFISSGRFPSLPHTSEFLDFRQISTELVPVTNAARSVVDQGQTTREKVTNAARSVLDQGETAGEGVTNDARSVPEQGRTTGESAGQPMQDHSVCTENVVEHSFVIIEDLESDIQEGEDEANSCQDEVPDSGINKASPILHDVCHNAMELDDIEHMFDEALKAQQKGWASTSSNTEINSL